MILRGLFFLLQKRYILFLQYVFEINLKLLKNNKMLDKFPIKIDE